VLDSLKSLWKRYGFYVSVLSCVLLLGVAAWMARANLSARPAPPPQLAPADAAPDFVESLNDRLSAPEPTPTPEPMPVFSWPINRAEERVVTPYSPVDPVWWESLGQWSTHLGIDFEGESGEVVYAAADGQVSGVYRDPLMGNVVEITHDYGYLTRYASLNTLNMVKMDERIARGTPIGGMSRSAPAEDALPPHLHFAMERDEAAVDPAGVILP